MILTNKYELPDAFFRAIKNDPYSKGESDFSATGLLNPPRAVVLSERHHDEIEIDISSRVAATIGQGVHSILERAQRPGVDIIETRYFGEFFVDGKIHVVSAQIDLYETDKKALYDWKTTKASAFHKKAATKAEWRAQLNIGALLLKRTLNEAPSSLFIIGLLKDWDRNKALSEPGYPPLEVMCKEIELWPEEKTTEFIHEKIEGILNARKKLPECTTKEAWNGLRCKSWCDASSVCEQYQKSKQTGILGGAV